MKQGFFLGVGLVSLLAAQSAFAATSAAGAKVYIAEPKDGAVVSGPVTVKMSVDNMAVVPAGTDQPSSGHHHLLVDAETPAAMDAPIPKDDNHLHFGKAQTETTLNLPPGKHTLQLIFADKDHVPHQPALVSDKITITVNE